MSLVFADTVEFIALWNRTDQWNSSALRAFSRPQIAESRLITTSYVSPECGNALARTSMREEVDRLRERMEAADTLIHPTEDDWRQSWKMYRQGKADDAGIVDQLSFVVMRRLGIRQAFTNDHHFRTAGFETLIQGS